MIPKSLRKKPTSLLLVLIVLLAGAFIIWRFAAGSGPARNAQPTAPALNNTANPQNAGIMPFAPASLAANRTAPVASGSDPRSARDYVQSLETLYQQRGYRKASFDPRQPRKAPAIPPGAAKLYWLGEAEEFHLISAFGADANLHSPAPAAQAETWVTLVRAGENGGVQWESYRFDANYSGPEAPLATGISEQDFSSIDPPGIPKHPSLTRVLSFGDQGNPQAGILAAYNSSEPPDSLIDWYRKQMEAQGWRLGAAETEGARQVNEGALCFTRGAQLCLLFIGNDEECRCASVVISLQQNTNNTE